MKKRGELTSSQIIGMVLVIAAFIILLLFLTAIFRPGPPPKEICHLSVVARASAPTAAQALVPLKCTTEKICISESGRNDACRQFAGEENVRGVEINLNKPDESANIIMKESADAMYDCWQMMGEGFLDIFGRWSVFGLAAPKCVVCSRLAIAEDLWNKTAYNDTIKPKLDINKFLAEHRPSDSIPQTYLQLFTDSSIQSFPNVADSDEQAQIMDANDKIEAENDQLVKGFSDPTQVAVLFSQIKTQKSVADVIAKVGIGGFAVAGGALLTPAGRLIATPPGIIVSLLAIGGTTAWAGFATYKSKEIAGSYCADFPGKEEDKNGGCTVIQYVPWDATLINGACAGGIEGNL